MQKATNPAQRGFTVRDRRKLVKAMQAANTTRLFRRLQAVLLVAEGHAPTEVTAITGLARSSVYHVVQQYLQTHQVTSLQDRARSGRPQTAIGVTADRLRHALAHLPREFGYGTNVWTVVLLGRHLKQQYDCAVSPRTLRRRMHALGLRCKRPRYVYAEREPHLPQKKGPLCAS